MQFSRTVAPMPGKGPALIAFMKMHKWERIEILTSSERNWFEARLKLAEQLAAAGIKVLKPMAFETGDLTDATLSGVRRSGTRIVLMLSWVADAQAAAVLSCRESMSRGWAWFVSYEVLAVPAMAGWLWFRPFLASTLHAFANQVSNYTKADFNLTVSPDSVDLTYSAALYNAVMLYAHAATELMSKGGDLQDGEAVTAAMRSTSFTGMGGTLVELDSVGDRIEPYEVMNYVLEEGDAIRSVPIGIFNSTLQQYRTYQQPMIWPGNSTDVPNDYFSGES